MGWILGGILGLLALAVAAPLLHRLFGRQTGWLLALAPGAAFGWLLAAIPRISEQGALVETAPWVEPIGLELGFRIDSLGLLFLLVVTGIAALIFVYAGGYLKGHPQLGRFYIYLLMFTAAMAGLVASDNLILLFVFWELTSLSSYLLIGFKHEDADSRKSALQALLVTGFGGLAFLAGVILLGAAAGSFSLAEINDAAGAVKASPYYGAAFILVCLGAFTKSAQWPFHFWLPGAMAAPTPVSAFLHSATMVNAGVFLLARLTPALGGTDAWHYTLTAFGTVTMLAGAVLAWPQTDLKRLLAYSTVSALGTMVLLLGLDTVLSVKAAMVFFLVHALYKGALFMVAGTIDHEAGTRDVRQLGGLIRAMPVTAVAAGVAAFSMTGLPPLLGFIGKELVYEAKTQAPVIGVYVTAAGFLGNALMVAVALIVGVRPFQGGKPDPDKQVHEGPLALWLGPAVLAGASLLLGIFPGWIDRSIITGAVAAVRAEETVLKLKLWHGLNLVLLLSVLTVALGIAAYFARHWARRIGNGLRRFAQLGPAGAYDALLAGLTPFADSLTRKIQHGRLRLYVATLIGFTALLTVGTLIATGLPPLDLEQQLALRIEEAALIATIIAAAIVTVFVTSRLAAVACLSVVGFGIAGIFGLMGGPDLALTQFLAETLLLVLFILMVYRLPRFGGLSSKRARVADAFLAISAGAVVSVLVFKALTVQTHSSISSFFTENSLVAKGRNVVNVILVDFRALDTLGEITVLAAAALGVAALIGRRGRDTTRKRREASDD